MRLSEGDRIGHYRIVATIGAGAMGAVYRVFDTNLQVERALKLVKLPELSDEDEHRAYRERFWREARTIANLHQPLPHPHIIQVHDMGELSGLPWFTMSAFPGVPLSEWISQRPRPHPDRALHVMKQLAAGLAHAHSRGVKHRDIKLTNALVSETAGDHAVLIDWGIAKADNDAHLTMTGVMSGTEAYMAPEYLAAGFRGEAHHTELTDLWALGVVFYAIATGKRAFDTSVAGYQHKIINAIYPHPLEIRCDLDDAFCAVITDLLRKEPAERIQSANELNRRLAAVKRTIDPDKPPFQSGNVVLSPPEPQTADPSVVANMKVIDPSSPQPTINARATSKPTPSQPPSSPTIDPFAAASPSQQRSIPSSPTGLPLPTDDVDDDLFGTRAPSSTGPSSKKEATRSPTVAPAPTSQAPLAAENTFLRALHGKDDPSVVQAPAAQTSSQPKPAAPADDASVIRPPSSSSAPSSAASSGDDASVVRAPLSFGQGAVALRAEKGKMEARRAGFLVATALGALVAVGFTATSMMDAGPSTNQPQQSGYVDPDTQKRERDAKAALAEIEREKQDQKDQQAKIAIALEERRKAEQAATAPPPEAPPLAPVPPSMEPVRATSGLRKTTTPAPAPPPAPEAVGRYGSRQSGNSASIASSGSSSASAATTTTAVQGARVPARLRAAATSAPGPIIAIVTQATTVGSLTIPAGTEVHGQPSGASGPRLTISFHTALIGGKNVALRGIAMGADQRAGLPAQRSLGNGTDTASDVAGSLVASAGQAVANATGIAPVADATRAATGSAGDKTRRLNTAEDILTVASGTRFLIYIEAL